LRSGFKAASKRSEKPLQRLCLQRPKELALLRVPEMNAFLNAFEQGTIGAS
jgi:hypothetical protein